MQYGIWDQVRVDHGKEFYLVLAVQDHLKDLRNNTRRYPYLQTQSKQVTKQEIKKLLKLT